MVKEKPQVKQKAKYKSKSPARKQQKQASGHPNSIENLRVGQGKGKSGGNGQMHHYRFASAFAAALEETMLLHGDLPNGNIVNADKTTMLLEAKLQCCWKQHCRQSERKNKPLHRDN